MASALALLLVGLLSADAHAESPQADKTADQNVKSLFDGKTLTGWKKTIFGGEGEVTVENGQIILDVGDPLTGITWENGADLPKDNYEISLSAMKLKGDDFFCGLTFPVGDSHASFIVGGWAGGIVGISSINGFDASENETTSFHKFDRDRWYKIRVRVAGGKLLAWIDDKELVNVDLKDKKLSTRGEVDLNKPLGISTYLVKSALKDLQIKNVSK